ncbi:MAG: hypothetical protein SGJ02_05020 [bacterium]|nr:hypothetical protein [bacterium]
MKKTYTKAQAKDINGSSFVGYLQGDYEMLFNSFSFPNDRTREDEWRSGDQKIRFEWAFKTTGRKPTVITIYDYKDPRPLEDIDMWHVGLKGDHKTLDAFFRKQSLFVMTPTFNTD